MSRLLCSIEHFSTGLDLGSVVADLVIHASDASREVRDSRDLRDASHVLGHVLVPCLRVDLRLLEFASACHQGSLLDCGLTHDVEVGVDYHLIAIG